MIDCDVNRNNDDFVKCYEVYDDVIRFYTKEGVFNVLNTSDNIKRLDIL